MLATNTSSLSVTELAAGVAHPERVVGMHFFNPAPVMRLVEVVAGGLLARGRWRPPRGREAMGKHVIDARDVPGFLVNRVNRPFSLESLRLVQEGWPRREQIDRIVPPGRRLPDGAVRADGPGRARRRPRGRRALLRAVLRRAALAAVAAGGADGGRGPAGPQDAAAAGTEYPPGPPREPEAARRRTSATEPVLERIVVQLVNEACFALGEGVGSAADIDAGMVLGLNHPRGPLEWGDADRPGRVLGRLTELREQYGEERYRPAPALVCAARTTRKAAPVALGCGA